MSKKQPKSGTRAAPRAKVDAPDKREAPAPKRPAQTADELVNEARARQPMPEDPLSPKNLRSLGLRMGLPVLGVWILVAFIGHWIGFVVAGVGTVAVAFAVWWALRLAKRTRGVATLMQGATSAEGRKAALEKLETEFKKDDSAALFAKAQLEMQDDPRKALATLEQIDLKKVMATVADEARTQRAMIHLMLGDTEDARFLVDGVDLARHKEAKSRGMMVAIKGEALARTGAAKKAVEMLETIDDADPQYDELRPQLLRARAFAYAWASQTKEMKKTLRSLNAINAQLLGGFITKKKHPMGVSPKGVHPILEKEAYDLLMKTGDVRRKVEYRRRP